MANFIATRHTAQGSIIHLWEDGAITWALGRYVKGSPCPKTDEARAEALRAGWLVMGEVELYNDDEIPALIAAARWTAKRSGDPGMLRDRLSSSSRLRLCWTTIETDRDGNARVQCCRLPRLRWPGVAVWRASGRYSIWTEIAHSGTYSPTGCEFSNLRDLFDYLDSIPLP